MDYKGAWELAELENSNLRKCLKWAAGHLLAEQIRELSKMIRNPVDEGGVVQDNVEADYEEAKDFQRLAVKAAQLLCEALECVDTNTENKVIWFKAALEKGYWIAQASHVMNLLAEYEPPSPEANLAEIRNFKELVDGKISKK